MKNCRKKIASPCLEVLKTLRELITKIKDEILLLALGIAIIIAFIALITQQFPSEIGSTFTQIFLIAAVYSLLKRILVMFFSSKKQRKIMKHN